MGEWGDTAVSGDGKINPAGYKLCIFPIRKWRAFLGWRTFLVLGSKQEQLHLVSFTAPDSQLVSVHGHPSAHMESQLH